MVRDFQRNHPTAARDVMRTTRVWSKVERSRACAPLTKTQVWDSGFFAHALFVPKTPNVMGFSGSVNGTTKNPGFLDFGFCQCKWAYGCKLYWLLSQNKENPSIWSQLVKPDNIPQICLCRSSGALHCWFIHWFVIVRHATCRYS